MKTIFNKTALKKAANKSALLFNYSGNTVIFWNKAGTICIKCNKLLFETEILNNIPVTQVDSLPTCIPETFKAFEDSNVLSETFLTIELQDISARIYQNYKHKYLTIINIELLKILNNIADFTPYQTKENRATLFKTDFIECIIMPMWNKGIAEKLTLLSEELKK